ncbi:hypothetical protein B0H16DRAFT_1794442 [Mycena metata]|uniref:Uncharacterized protein n=1 Tax=Mycena metata TaxID=1033252 RepID=A0AAD7HDU7_9AGAR|nr:hypothetical protein B0H16DRAFT_1475737 [Mycena metata]KAJ7719680.1 hypothetical protein B0H16DRAFT_1794442 [Mycena metata]
MNRINATEPFTDAVPLDTVPQLVEYPIKHANSCTPEMCTQSEEVTSRGRRGRILSSRLRGASGTSAFSEGGPSKDVSGGSTQPCYRRADRTTPRDIQQTPNTTGRVMLICKLQEIEIENDSGPARPTSLPLARLGHRTTSYCERISELDIPPPRISLSKRESVQKLIEKYHLKQEHDLKNANLIIPNTPAAHDGFLVWNLDLDHTQNQGERVKTTNSGCRTTAKLLIELIYIILEFKFNLIKVQL